MDQYYNTFYSLNVLKIIILILIIVYILYVLCIRSNTSGLPFFEVLVTPTLPKGASLPVATVQMAKERIVSGVWRDVDYIYFTESDQILMFQIPLLVYDHLKAFPNRVIVPHRLMPYPNIISKKQLKKDIISRSDPLLWTNYSCCLTRQNCRNRNDWVAVSNKSVSFINIFGLDVALGNTNFHKESYRACKISNYRFTCP